MPTPTVIAIMGPTAVGKTNISIQVAQQLHSEILSADSRQCYKGMDIGTAMPTLAERSLVPHHFINDHDVTEALTVADYERIGLETLTHIFSKNEVAVVCGGTGLYIKALLEGIDAMPPVDEAINAQIHQEYEQKGLSWLQATLKTTDPNFYEVGEIQNPARVIRALVFALSTGSSILQYHSKQPTPRPFRILKFGLELPREQLYQRINLRVDQMMEQGLLQEARQLYPQKHLKNLHTVGYSELFDHFDGLYSLSEAVDKIKQHSRNYAKRQLTWFKKDAQIQWLSADMPLIANTIIDRYMSTL
jgi:tRNA dimethylallyltransferase